MGANFEDLSGCMFDGHAVGDCCEEGFPVGGWNGGGVCYCFADGG